VTIALAFVILVPALWGFGTKFLEFLALVGDEEGAFTVVPILNYLLVSLGFLLLFLWAICHGMFRDVEKPKYTMIANEQRLDEEAEWDHEVYGERREEDGDA
jgi:hypothetical protein